MTDRIRLTILGCGSSPGVPRITGDWGNCDPANPKNHRLRAGALFERIGEGGTTRVAIDTGPDFRQQMIAAKATHLDAVLYTHAHADHIHGVDDLRSYALKKQGLIDIHADESTLERLIDGFGYCFRTPEGSSYPPILKAHLLRHFQPVVIDGAGGPLTLEPLPQRHGSITSLAVRSETIAYCSDVSGFDPPTVARLEKLDYLIIDALQYRRHPSHFSFDEALEWIEVLAPKQAILTHMHVPLDYDVVMNETPDNVVPAYDGLTVEVPVTCY